MKTTRLPAIVFALVLLGYVVFLLCTVSLLPLRMATHFGANGRPNGWMNRSSAVIFQGVVGLILPLIIMAAFFSIRFVPAQYINMPRRDFWLSPERRADTCAYFSRGGLWFASLLVGLQGVIWYQLIESNGASLPDLSPPAFLFTLGTFGVAMIVLVMGFFRHFTKAA